MKQRFIYFIALSTLLFFLTAGCKQLDSFSSEGSGASDAVISAVTFNLDFSSLLSSTADTGGSGAPSLNQAPAGGPSYDFDAGSAVYFSGLVTFEDTTSGATHSYEITAGLDASFDAVLEHTLALPGGHYNISVGFSNASQEYYGSASNVTINEDAANSVAIEVHPVIGDTVMTGEITSQVPMYYFQYQSGDFDSSGDTYTMTVTMDSGAGTEFTFAEFTEAARLYMNIADGTHDVKIEIKKNGPTVVARFHGIPDFTTGTNQTFDLVPIFGTSTFVLSETGGDATFDIKIKETTYDLVDTETGGNFEYKFKASGTHNTIPEVVLLLTEDATGDWTTTRTYSSFQFDTMNVEIEIWDTVEEEKIGNCAFAVTLTNTANPVSCGLTLNRRAQISGRVLQVLAVTVNYDLSHATKANQPASLGTSVYLDGVLAGITGGATVSDNGLVIFLQPDATHDIYAMDASGDTSPVSQFYAESWGIDNLTLKID